MGWIRIGALLVCGCAFLLGAEIKVPAGGDLQQALNAAQPGDIITLEAGVQYVGNFTLPVKTGSTYITIRGSRWQSLPASGIRIKPVHFPALPKLLSPLNFPVVTAANGAHHYRFDGIELGPVADRYMDDVVRCGSGETSEAQLPYEIQLIHVYVHGDPVQGGKRGVGANCRALTVRDSHLSDFKSSSIHTQAIAGWNSPGPFTIVNNYLEAAGENIVFGGASPTIPNVIPSDIQIQGNHMFKPLSWKQGHATYAGQLWLIANHIEFKMARRAVIQGNIFENCWAQGDQPGTSIVLFAASSNAPWATIEDIAIQKNSFRYVQGGVNLQGGDPYAVPITTQGTFQRVTIRDNVFEKVFQQTGLASLAVLFRVVNGAADSIIDHNTAFNDGAPLVMDGNTSISRLVNKRVHFTNNIVLKGDCDWTCGFDGRATPRGIPALNLWNPGWVVDRNVMVGGALLNNPAVTYEPPTLADVGFQNLSAGDYRLASGSPFKNAGTDGRDPGADVPAVNLAVAAAGDGNPPASPCAITIYPLNATYPQAGGSGTLTVSAPRNCAWSAQPPPFWIAWTGPWTGTGNGTLSYVVSPLLSGARRAATLAVGGRKVGITQLP